MLLTHILLAVITLGLATMAATKSTVQKIMITSIISFIATLISGIALQVNHGGLNLHGVSMLALFALIYGMLLRSALRTKKAHDRLS